ncbi:MFS transporter [Hydrogenophaga electricum]|uniref:MFS transporter n=1 Tax=Hydrogenophaga electricum TaxID=1230953 RepID=A0ABQ6C118_9BURK|nr:MFS transporter [Hydrogenophaga electricum]GLS12689.1 MFS transporter [Hydrogenophaga electricum]
MKALFAADALNPGVRRREVFGWAMYDFANSGYTTVVLTAVFAAYFVGAVAGGRPWSTFAWTAALSLSNALVMLSIPVMGAWADRRAAKKRLLMIVTAGCVLSTAALAGVQPGGVVLALVLVVVSNACYAWGESLVAAFLPELARPEAMGRVSGWGWSLGYLGGMLALGLSLAYVLWAQAQGQSADRFVPVTMLITAVTFGLSAGVTFALVRERPAAETASASVALGWRSSWRQLGQTLREARQYRDFLWLLGCAVAYQGGVAVAVALAAIYAEQVVGFAQQETMALIFVLNIAAMLGAFVFGYGQDRLGHKRALGITLIGWAVTCIIAALTTTKGGFWWAAVIAGLCMGSSQSAGRAMAGVLAPPARLAEFYGLWTFAIRLASILGPLSYGVITWATGGNQRLAIGFTAGLFLVGLALLQPVDMQRGRQRALQPSRPSGGD